MKELVVEREKTGLVPWDYSALGSKSLQDKRVALATSTSKTTINASGSINDLMNEMNKLCAYESDDEFLDFKKKLKKKSDYAAACAKVQTKAFATHEALCNRLNKEAELAEFGGKSTQEEWQMELEQKFWLTKLRIENAALTGYRVEMATNET